MDPVVHQRVAGAAVEAEYGVARVRTLRRQDGEVGDAPDVAYHAPSIGQAEQRAMQRWYERGALTAGSDIAAAKIGNNVDAGAFSQHRRVLALARIADAVMRAGLMTDRLSVRADGPYVARDQAGGRKQLGDTFGVDHG